MNIGQHELMTVICLTGHTRPTPKANADATSPLRHSCLDLPFIKLSLGLLLRQSPASVQLPLRITGMTPTHVTRQMLHSESLPLERRSQTTGDTQRVIGPNPSSVPNAESQQKLR